MQCFATEDRPRPAGVLDWRGPNPPLPVLRTERAPAGLASGEVPVFGFRNGARGCYAP